MFGRTKLHRPPARNAAPTAPACPSDDELIQGHDRDASFTAMYERYADSILTYCRLRIGNAHDAEDVAAQVFAAVYRAYPPDSRGTFRSWLFTIAHNTVVNYYRTQGRHARHRTLDDRDAQSMRDTGESPEDLALRNDTARTLREALSCLDENQRRVMELRLAGLKGSEIAVVIGRSESAVKMLQFRAMKRLRTMLVKTEDASISPSQSTKERTDAV